MTDSTGVPPEPVFDRVHHVGINVSDLDQSVGFYRDLLGVEPLFVNDMRGGGLARGAGVDDPDLRFCLMKISNVVLELIEWRSPRSEPPQAGAPFVGGFHIAFEVDDIEAVHKRLKERGVETVAPPHRFDVDDESPAMIGAQFAYFSDPDGIGLEIFQKRSRFNDY